MISVKHMSLLIKIMKAMKCDRFIILPDRIIGADNQLVSITEAYVQTMIEAPYFEINKEILKEFDETVKKYTKSVSDKSKLEEAKVDNLLKYRSIIRINDIDIINTYNSVCNSLSPNLLIDSVDNLKEDENFNYCMALKSKEGLGKFIYNNRFISIFSGLLPVNKADTVRLEVYNGVTNNSYICKFIINKKYTILNKYIRYIPLI